MKSTITTTIQPDGTKTIQEEEILPDGRKQVTTTIHPGASVPPGADGSTAIATAVPAAAASAARAAMPAPVPPRMGRLSTTHTCQFCQHTGPTYVKEKFGTCAIIAIVVLVLCFWPLFFLPLIMPSCKDKEHICTNCQRVVGENEADCDTCCQTETR